VKNTEEAKQKSFKHFNVKNIYSSHADIKENSLNHKRKSSPVSARITTAKRKSYAKKKTSLTNKPITTSDSGHLNPKAQL
jgi:hypothetical protein